MLIKSNKKIDFYWKTIYFTYMKHLKRIHFVIALAIMAFHFNGCGDDGGSPASKTTGAGDESLREYLGSEKIQTDLGNLAEFAYYSEYLKAAPIAFMASDKGLFTKKVSDDEYEEYFGVISKMSDKSKEYEASWARIDSMKALVTTTPTLKKIGFAYSFGEFCYALWHTGAEMREKSMTRIAQLNDNERRILFEGLSSNLQKGETDYRIWWRKFSQGDFDKASAQIYNNFMHNGESSFMDEADPIVKVVADKGKELVEKGAEFETEVLKTVLPEPVTDAMSEIETLEKVNTIVTKGKDMSADELKNNVLNLIEGYEDAEKLVKMVVGYHEEKSTTTDNYDKNGASVITFKDTTGTAAKSGMISIAVNEETGKTTIALGANKDGEVEIVVKDAGKHLVSFLTTAGNKLTQEIDVVKGKLKEIIGQMNEKDIRDSLKKTSSASAKAKSSASKKIIRSSSSTKVNTKYPSSIHGRWEVTKEIYIHKITNRDLCYKMFSSDGDDSFAKEECRDHEEEDDYCVGNAMNVYSDGTIDYLAGKKQTSFHYTYDKTKGILSYTDVDGETYSIQASSNGKTMIMETVTDAGYMKITHRLTFTKITDDIE